MEIKELEKTKMDVLKEVATSSVLVAGMKAEMLSLEKEKDDFFVKRKKEVVDRIKSILQDSRELLDETSSNYKLVHDFYTVLKSFSDTVLESHNKLKENIDDFNESVKLHNLEMSKQEEELSHLKKMVKQDSESNEREKKHIKEMHKSLEKEKLKINDSREMIKRTIERLKNNKI
jgi:hypothetical protein